MIDVSIIIVSYNTRDLTLACLRSVYAQAHDVSSEVLVVDNASTDGSAAVIATEFPNVRLWALDANLGFAAANNLAARHAVGEWLLLLNPDTLVLPNAIPSLVRFAESHPRAAVVGGRALNADGSLQPNCFEPPNLWDLWVNALGLHRLAPRSRVFGRERLLHRDYDQPMRVPVVAGCFMLVRQAAIQEVGLLDEAFFMYAEEVDWCVRFRRHGWQVWYTPAATLIHYGGVSAAYDPHATRTYARQSLLRFLRKYHGQTYVAGCQTAIATGRLLRAIWSCTRRRREPVALCRAVESSAP
ncbi:MAG: glycosyltransferase family 2 protein [Planctomycetota bacterium]